jgi:hypothetical protein
MKNLILLPVILFFCSTQLSSQTFPILLDSPEITGSVNGNGISLTLFNTMSSNNYNESFNVYDPRIQNAPDTSWDFEGYIIYQLDSCRFPWPVEFYGYDTNYVRQVAQCDLANGIATLINHDSANTCAPMTMVAGADAGIQHNFNLTIDAFTGQPFQSGSGYYFTAIAYGHNAYYSDSSCAPLLSPFLRGTHQRFICVQLTGINELKSNHTPLSVFPSPAESQLSVDLLDVHSNVKLIVYDVTGQQVKELVVSGGSVYQLDLSGLSSGTYFLGAISQEKVMNARFIRN